MVNLVIPVSKSLRFNKNLSIGKLGNPTYIIGDAMNEQILIKLHLAAHCAVNKLVEDLIYGVLISVLVQSHSWYDSAGIVHVRYISVKQAFYQT